MTWLRLSNDRYINLDHICDVHEAGAAYRAVGGEEAAVEVRMAGLERPVVLWGDDRDCLLDALDRLSRRDEEQLPSLEDEIGEPT